MNYLFIITMLYCATYFSLEHAAIVPHDTTPKFDFKYVVALPLDVQRLIIALVDDEKNDLPNDESDEEFIQRTQSKLQGIYTEKQLQLCRMSKSSLYFEANKVRYTNNINVYNRGTKKTKNLIRWNACYPRTILFSYSANGVYSATLEPTKIDDPWLIELKLETEKARYVVRSFPSCDCLSIYDLRLQDKKQSNKFYLSARVKFGYKDSECVAFAFAPLKERNAFKIARVHKRGKKYFCLLAQRDGDNIKQSESLLSLKTVSLCAFNKQGTKVIVHDGKGSHQIIALDEQKEDDLLKSQHASLFIDYFKAKRVSF